MRVLSIFNMKGGVGKTITAVNVAAILATDYDQRVLLVDADAQGNSTNSLLPPGNYSTLELLLTGREAYYENLIYNATIRNLDVLPADDGLRALELSDCHVNAVRDLRDALTEDDAYDWIVIDCPPDFPPACVAAIAATDSVIIPLKLDRYSMDGMQGLVEQIGEARKVYPDLHISGCLVTFHYRCNAVLQGEALLRDTAPIHVYRSVIRRCAKVDESTWMGQPVVAWSPRSSAAQDYRAFVAEYLAQEEVRLYGR